MYHLPPDEVTKVISRPFGVGAPVGVMKQSPHRPCEPDTSQPLVTPLAYCTQAVYRIKGVSSHQRVMSARTDGEWLAWGEFICDTRIRDAFHGDVKQAGGRGSSSHIFTPGGKAANYKGKEGRLYLRG